MKIRTALIISASTLVLAGTPAVALASTANRPAPTAECVKAKDALAAAVKLTVLYNPNVYPEGKVPAVDAVTPALLNAVLADADLGGGARAEVTAALTAFQAKHDACDKPPVVVTTPPVTTAPTTAPTTTTEAPPTGDTTTTAPTSVVILPVPVVTEGTSQIGTAPSGSVNTGGE